MCRGSAALPLDQGLAGGGAADFPGVTGRRGGRALECATADGCRRLEAWSGQRQPGIAQRDEGHLRHLVVKPAGDPATARSASAARAAASAGLGPSGNSASRHWPARRPQPKSADRSCRSTCSPTASKPRLTQVPSIDPVLSAPMPLRYGQIPPGTIQFLAVAWRLDKDGPDDQDEPTLRPTTPDSDASYAERPVLGPWTPLAYSLVRRRG